MQRLFKLFVKNITGEKQDKKENDKKVHLKTFKESLKLFFINKRVFIFLALFFVGNFLLYFQYADALKAFALSEKIFTMADVQKAYPGDLFSDKFTCETATMASVCDGYSFALLGIFLFLEGFVVYSFIKNRRAVSKKLLAVYSVFLQLLLVVPLLALSYAPDKALAILGDQANREIIESTNLLNNKEELKKLSIEDSLSTIRKKIEMEDNLPALIEDSPKEQAILYTLGIKQDTKDSLYKVAIVPYQVYYASAVSLEKEKIKFEVLLFSDNILIVNSVNKNLLEELVPVLANKIILAGFKEYVKGVRVFPKVDVPEEKEYRAIRERENEKIKQDILNDIQEIKDNIAYNQSALSENEQNIIEVNREYDRYKAYGERWLEDCRRVFGAGDRDCIDGEKTVSSELQALINAKHASEENIKNIKFYISEGQGYLYIAQKNYEEFKNNPNPPENELGVFLSPNTIHLKYVPSENYLFSKYLSTAIHEYLHFYSYSTSPRGFELPNFLDEGITDYLTSITMDDFLNYKTQHAYVGYLNEVEIVGKISALLTKDYLKKIYFSKNENDLKKSIDDHSSKGIYDIVKDKGDLLYKTSVEDKETQESLKKQIFEILSQKEA